MPLKTLFLNPPSFEKFDGGASSRWPATREIESYWYPVWLTYPAGMLEGSRLLDAPPHHIKWQEVVEILKDYEFLVLFTSTMGWDGDQKMAEVIKQTYPTIKICLRRPAGHHLARQGPQRVPRHRLHLPPRVRLLRRRVSPTASRSNEILGVSYKDEQRRDPAQSRPPAGHARAARRDALGHRDLPPRPRRHQVQRARSCCTPTSRSTPPAAAPRSAPSASGPRPSPATPGASAPPTTSRPR